ncbi:hypothetical protein [Kaarinaea lacus]
MNLKSVWSSYRRMPESRILIDLLDTGHGVGAGLKNVGMTKNTFMGQH